MALQAREIADLVVGTLNDLGPPRFQQVAQNLQEYEVMGKWLKEDRIQIDDGIGIQRTLMTSLPDSAAHVGLGDPDNVNIKDLLRSINIPWRHAKTDWGFFRQEILMNRGKSLVAKVIEPRRIGAMINLAEVLETTAWTCPASDNETEPYGIPYWIVTNSSSPPGFNGGVPSGHTTIAGIVPPANFYNYTGTYSAVSKADLIRKLRLAHRKTKWVSPVTVKDLLGPLGERRRLYVDNDTLLSIEDQAEAQNDNLGPDVASMAGTVVFRKHPIIAVPQLDVAPPAANPVYMIDHGTFYPVVLKGDYLHESEPDNANTGSHNAFAVFVDLTYNYFCADKRRNAVFYKV